MTCEIGIVKLVVEYNQGEEIMNKKLFSSKSSAVQVKETNTVNEAGGKAYKLSDKAALAQYALTGTFNGVFYASDEDQLKKVLELADKCDPEFVAKLAVYAREEGFMKDMPAFLAAVVSSKDTALLQKIFTRVVDSPKMVRNFMQIVRSGATGRKSFGTRPKKLLQAYFENLTDDQLFRASIGNDPSLADMIKMVRPKPGDKKRSALYAYLLDKEYNQKDLLPLARAFEDFKKDPVGELPGVPFEMLTSLPLTKKHWKELAQNMTWAQTRINLNTMLRHGVLEDKDMVEFVANKLQNEDLIKKAKAFPYQLFAAFKNVESNMPQKITLALQKAAEIAIQNVPEFDGQVYVCCDISGSMHSPATGGRGSATTKVSCLDVAALMSAAVLRKNPEATVIPFSDHVVPCELNPLDSVMTNTQKLASLPSGGTNCASPLQMLNKKNAKGDLVIVVSDNQSWHNSGHVYYNGTAFANEWATFKKRNPKAKLVELDIQPYATSQVSSGQDILQCGGFSDNIFNVVKKFSEMGNNQDLWVKTIEAVKL